MVVEAWSFTISEEIDWKEVGGVAFRKQVLGQCQKRR